MPGDGARSGSTTTAPRRFGTVSNTSIAHENGEFPRQEAASLGQEGSSVNREGRGVEDARGGGTGVTSQVIAIPERLTGHMRLFATSKCVLT